LKAKGRGKRQARAATPTQVATAEEERASKDLADFSDEYHGLRLSLKVEGLGEVEGRLLKASRYWFKLLTNDGVLYLNKAYVISIKPLELAPPVQATKEG